MYKLLLCIRYLRTRYIALACIISVTLGVATMIVVNSVMSGFGHEMNARIQSMTADLSLEARSQTGFPDANWHMDEIRRILGDKVVAMTPTVHAPALMDMKVGTQTVTNEIVLVGIDPTTFASVSKSSEYLQHPENRKQLNFNLREDGFDPRIPTGGWKHRRKVARREKELEAIYAKPESQPAAAAANNPSNKTSDSPASDEPVDDWGAGSKDDWGTTAEKSVFDKEKEQFPGAVLGIGLASFRTTGPDGESSERFLTVPGEDVSIAFWLSGMSQRTAVNSNFTVVDFSESKMSEFDSRFVFVHINELQRMRGMIDPTSGVANVSSIQIDLRDGVDPEKAKALLVAHFPEHLYGTSTPRDKQGPLMDAVQMETVILNILLFMIIAVAGFGILAIFSMIVAEKTKDIGVLKSLGASSSGVMGIFLGYGLSLGLVGSGGGMVLGLLIVYYIDDIRRFIEKMSGQTLFDPNIYYFQNIPTLVEPWTVGWIVVGAMLIAVMASILPAFRAARLQPVEALRYE